MSLPVKLGLTSINFSFSSIAALIMDVLELKREIELLSERLGKTQDYL